MSGNTLKAELCLWAALSARPFPYLHELAPRDRDRFVLLDSYLRDCLEEWYASGGQLSACSIILLDACAQSITRRIRFLDGEGQYYFGQFRRLARRILRGVDVKCVFDTEEQGQGGQKCYDREKARTGCGFAPF